MRCDAWAPSVSQIPPFLPLSPQAQYVDVHDVALHQQAQCSCYMQAYALPKSDKEGGQNVDVVYEGITDSTPFIKTRQSIKQASEFVTSAH